MHPIRYGLIAWTILVLAAPTAGGAAEDTLTTMVSARTSKEYRRVPSKGGGFKPEFYALANGGRIAGTTADTTVDRVTYPEVAEIAMKLLAQQNFRYAEKAEQATLLLMLQWGSTLAPNSTNKDMSIATAQVALQTLQSLQGSMSDSVLADNTAAGFGPSPGSRYHTNEVAAVSDAANSIESQMFRLLSDNRVRDQLNERNARILGYMDDLADSNDIRRWAGGGDRYNDLLGDIEESRYYIVISAYDFAKLTQRNEKKLLWQVRVSVRSPGNAFDKSVAAMMKSAAHYFGQNRNQLIRGEETKGTVEMRDLRFLGEAKEPAKEPKK